MPTVARLRGRRTFAELAQRGRTLRSGPLRVRYLDAPTGPAVGYAVGKKVGGAVERNRIRRRLRAAISACPTALTSGFYLVSTDAAARNVPFDDLVAAFDAVAAKVRA